MNRPGRIITSYGGSKKRSAGHGSATSCCENTTLYKNRNGRVVSNFLRTIPSRIAPVANWRDSLVRSSISTTSPRPGGLGAFTYEGQSGDDGTALGLIKSSKQKAACWRKGNELTADHPHSLSKAIQLELSRA